MEIERKYLIRELPAGLDTAPYADIWQAYISTAPVIRIRQKGDRFELTCKGKGKLAREELNLPISQDQFDHLRTKIEGRPIEKRRYKLPCPPYTIELDIFHGHMEGLILAEVEFPSLEEADRFVPPAWFGREVTEDSRYHNAAMSRL